MIPFYGFLCGPDSTLVCFQQPSQYLQLFFWKETPLRLLELLCNDCGCGSMKTIKLAWFWSVTYTPEFLHENTLKLPSMKFGLKWNPYLAFSLFPFYFSHSHYWSLPPAPLLHPPLCHGNRSLINHLHANPLLRVCFCESWAKAVFLRCIPI